LDLCYFISTTPLRSAAEVLGFLGVFALSFFLFVMVAFQRLNAVFHSGSLDVGLLLRYGIF